MRLHKNTVPAIAITIALLALCPVFAAEPVPSGNSDGAQVSPATPAKSPVTDAEKTLPLADPIPLPALPPSLLPDEIPPRAKRVDRMEPPARVKPDAKLKQQAAAAEIDLRIRYSKARNIAETSDRVRLAWEETRYPKSDQEKRDALRRYYDLLFAKMLSVDRGIAALVEERRKAGTAMLVQTRIAPTVRNE